MARCKSCSAPLPANQLNCLYCGIRNDLDLHSRFNLNAADLPHQRICPQCDLELGSYHIELDNKELLQIERCEQCFGLFFDKGEIEQLMEHSVSGFISINHNLITHINQDRFQNREIKYRKCPVCSSYMQRKNYGQRSGVIVDRCMEHGIWLDNGELIHLLEWKKAGGKILDEKVNELNQQEQKKEQEKESYRQAFLKHKRSHFSRESKPDRSDDLMDDITDFLLRLF